MPNPLVSIIMPMYNAASQLGVCIHSILQQTYPHWELIVIDDGSTDTSVEVVKNHIDSRIKLIENTSNLGLGRRLNEAVSVSKGEFIARMDADDVMFPDRLEKQVQYLLQHPNVDALGGWAIVIDDDYLINGTINLQLPSSFKSLVVWGSCFIHPTVMAKASWFKQNNYNPHLTRLEDYELWVRTFRTSSFALLSEPIIFYRSNGVMVKSKYVAAWKNLFSVLKNHRKAIPFLWKWQCIAISWTRVYCYTLLTKMRLLHPISKQSAISIDAYAQVLKKIRTSAV